MDLRMSSGVTDSTRMKISRIAARLGRKMKRAAGQRCPVHIMAAASQIAFTAPARPACRRGRRRPPGPARRCTAGRRVSIWPSRASRPCQNAKSLTRLPSSAASATEARNGSDCTASASANRSISRTCSQLVACRKIALATSKPPITASQNAGKSALRRPEPPLAVRTNGRPSLIRPKPTARATVHCRPMAANTAPSIWPPGSGPAAGRARRNARPPPRRRRGSEWSESCREWRCRRWRRTAPR